MITVVDTGPLLALAKVQALALLKRLYGEVLTTPAVYTEAVTAGYACNAPDARILDLAFKDGSLRVKTPQTVANFAAAGCAARVKGTLGVVVSATQQALLDKTEAIALITSLKVRPDVWLNAALCDQVIRVLEAC